MSGPGAGQPHVHGESHEGFSEATREAIGKHKHEGKRVRFEVVSMEIEATFASPGAIDTYKITLRPLD